MWKKGVKIKKGLAKKSDPQRPSGRKPKVPYAMRNVTKMDIVMLYAMVITCEKHRIAMRNVLMLFEMSLFPNGFTIKDLNENPMFPQWMLDNFQNNHIKTGWVKKEKKSSMRNIYWISDEGKKLIDDYQKTLRIQLIRFKSLLNETRAGLWNNLSDTDITEATTLAQGARPKKRTKVHPDTDTKDI